MALEIVLLSNLRAGPVHGYELKRRVQRPLAAALSNNSLYPILTRLEREGAVTHETREAEGRPPRKVYALTLVGRERLRAAITVLPDDLADDEEEFLLRVGFFAELTVAQRLGVVAARDAALERGLAQASVQECDRGRVVYLEEASHWVQHEEPERVNRLLIDFLRA